MQPVDLMAALVSERGFSEPEAAALLDASPPLQFSICYGARWDCRAVCEVSMLLHLHVGFAGYSMDARLGWPV